MEPKPFNDNPSEISSLSLPPLVPGLPILGNLLSLKNDPIHFLVKAAAKYGPVFRLRGPGDNVTVLAGPEVSELVQNDGSNGLHRREIFDAFSTEAGVDIFGIQGDKHAQLRRLVKFGYSRQVAAQFVGRMEREMLPTLRAWNNGDELNLFEVTSKLSLYCMMAAVTPIDLKTSADDLIRFGNTVMYAVTKGRPKVILYLPKYKSTRDRVYKTLDQIVERHRDGEFKASTEMYLADAFLEVRAIDGTAMNERDVRGGLAYALCGTEIYIGRLAGFLIFELLKNRTLLGHVQAEIDAAFGKNRAIDSNLFSRMPFLRGAYFETLRAYPLLPGLPFRAERDLEFTGYRIPKGELVLVTSVPWHFDHEHYENPLAFDATRCMSPRNEHLKPKAFAPFGLGKRTCAAGGMVEIITLTMVSTLIREWELEIARSDFQMELKPTPLIAPSKRLLIRTCNRRKRSSTADRFALAEKSDLVSAISELRAQHNLPKSVEAVFPVDTILIHEGEVADCLYVLLGGEVDVVRGPSNEKIARLRPGRIFGEIGLLKGVPRNASVVARTTVQLLKIERRDFLDWLEKTDLTALELGLLLQQEHIQKAVSKAIPGFQRLTHHGRLRLRNFSAGETLFRQGDTAEHFYVLKSGSVSVLRMHKSGDEQIEAELKSGDYFGEMGILKSAPRNATVRAKTDTEVVVIDRELFLEWLETSASAREDIALTVCRRLLADLKDSNPTQ